MEFLSNNWFELTILVLVFPAYNGIKIAVQESISTIPARLHQRQMEELKMKNDLLLQENEHVSTRELQVDNYYRSISGEKMEQLFSEWTDVLMDLSKIMQNQPKFHSMIKDLMMYGSEDTIQFGAVYMQYTYGLTKNNDKNKAFVLMYLGAALISSLKKDFTGYEIKPDELIKMKFKDILKKENKIKYIEGRKTAEKLIRDGFKI